MPATDFAFLLRRLGTHGGRGGVRVETSINKALGGGPGVCDRIERLDGELELEITRPIVGAMISALDNGRVKPAPDVIDRCRRLRAVLLGVRAELDELIMPDPLAPETDEPAVEDLETSPLTELLLDDGMMPQPWA
jgi:hypothetical protein